MKRILQIAAIGMMLMTAGVLFGCDNGGGGGMETEPMPQEEIPQQGEEEEEADEGEETEQEAEEMPAVPGN